VSMSVNYTSTQKKEINIGPLESTRKLMIWPWL
jgi:hypothetical protein